MTSTPSRGSHYVAMGSSFGAGFGLSPRAPGSPRRAGRSSINYAHLIARTFGLDLTDVTFSGATTSDLINVGQVGQPPQLDAVRRQTKLVTITAGGNDLGYVSALTDSSLPRPIRNLSRVRSQLNQVIDPSTMDERVQRLQDSLVGIVKRIQQRAPEARIMIVDYLTVLPDDLSLVGATPEAPAAKWALAAAAKMSEVFAKAAELTGSEMVPAGELSKPHHAWSAEPWTRKFHYSLRGGAPYHPNPAGMRAVADLLTQTLTQG